MDYESCGLNHELIICAARAQMLPEIGAHSAHRYNLVGMTSGPDDWAAGMLRNIQRVPAAPVACLQHAGNREDLR